MWVCLLYLWLLSHVLTWGILLFWFVFLKAVSQFFHLRTKGLMSVNGYGGDWITGPLRVVSSNWWIFEHMKSLWLLVFSVIEGGLFSCRHSMMSKVLERIQNFNLAFFFFFSFLEKDRTLLTRDLQEQPWEPMMLPGTQERSTREGT